LPAKFQVLLHPLCSFIPIQFEEEEQPKFTLKAGAWMSLFWEFKWCSAHTPGNDTGKYSQ
jgi:hypothetical protein